MLKSKIVALILSTFAILACFSCSAPAESEPTHSENVSSVQQGVIRDTFMWVQPGELQMVSPRGNLYDDRNNPSTNLIHVTALVGVCQSTYSTTYLSAIICMSQAQFNDINSKLAQCYPPNYGHMWFILYYDDAGFSANKSVFSYSYGVGL